MTGTVIPFSFTSYPPSADFSTNESTFSSKPDPGHQHDYYSYICQLEFPPGTTYHEMEEYIKTNQLWVWFFSFLQVTIRVKICRRNLIFDGLFWRTGRSFMITWFIFSNTIFDSIPETKCQLKLCHFLYILQSVINSCLKSFLSFLINNLLNYWHNELFHIKSKYYA